MFRVEAFIKAVIDILVQLAEVQMLILAHAACNIHINIFTKAEGDCGLPIF